MRLKSVIDVCTLDPNGVRKKKIGNIKKPGRADSPGYVLKFVYINCVVVMPFNSDS